MGVSVMRVKKQTLWDALTSPPGSAPYREIIPLIGWETLRTIYDHRKLILEGLQKYNEIYVFDGRYVTKLVKYGNYVEVSRMQADAFFLIYVPILKGGEEIGLVEPQLWIIEMKYGEIKSYEVRRVADVKTVLAEVKRMVEEEDKMHVVALFIEEKIKWLNEDLMKIAFRNIEYGVGYLRGLIADTIAALFHYADKEAFLAFVRRLKEQWGPLLEALGIRLEDVIATEVKEAMKAGNQAIAEKLEVLKELGGELR